MSIVHDFRKHPEQILDRLVDGELGIDDRRALLAAFDDEPGAWRRCALAYIEAQVVGFQLAQMANEPLVAHESARARAVAPAHRGGWIAWPLTLAASVLIAFVTGQRLAERQSGLPVSVDTAAEGGPGTAVVRTESSDAESQRDPGTVALHDGKNAIEQPWAESDGPALNAAVRSQAITGALAQQFQRDGFQVDRQQQLWPVELPDGSSVLVPVEEMHIQAPDVERL